MEQMLFDNWASVLRTAVVGVLAYVTLVVFLRISGKRTLSKMNAFDLVVTVALGSTLATILLNQDVALAEGATAFLVLILLQYTVAWLSVRVGWFESLVKSEPALLLYQGEFLPRVLKRERMTESEVRAAVRAQGLAGLEEVEAVVLETDGTISVIARGQADAQSSLQGVYPAPEKVAAGV